MARKTRTFKQDPGRRASAVTVKGTDEWKAWLDKAADHCGMTVSGLVDMSVRQFAKKQGFADPPPER
jgi:hypothetical protein